jgi:hypothetical protein
LIPPKIRLSPAGDLLTERAIFSKLLEPGAVWTTGKALDYASDEYIKKGQENNEVPPENLGWEIGLRNAVEAEYQVSAEAFVDLQFALTQLAEASKIGIIPAKHSELKEILETNSNFPKSDVSAFLKRLTLRRRASWHTGLSQADIDLGRFDRPFSLINRPLLMLDDNENDPFVLVSPVLVSDSAMYSLSGLIDGHLNNVFWESSLARSYAGSQGDSAGDRFEDEVASRLKELGLEVYPRFKPSAALNQKVTAELGDIDVLAITPDRKRVWVIEAKNLRLCRTETEVASRMSEYRGALITDSKGRSKPDKMLRHVRRVKYLRLHTEALAKTMKLDGVPEVRGLLIVDSPQPINFHMLDNLDDAESTFLGIISSYQFTD